MSQSRKLTGALLAGLSAVSILACAGPACADEMTRLRREAAHISIVRDDWGVAHIHGGTDAQAVFGMIYAQAEDDFRRVETNYTTSLGRLRRRRERARSGRTFASGCSSIPPICRRGSPAAPRG